MSGYCCEELAKGVRYEWIEWTDSIAPAGWVIWVGRTGEYAILFIKYCPYCGTELEEVT